LVFFAKDQHINQGCLNFRKIIEESIEKSRQEKGNKEKKLLDHFIENFDKNDETKKFGVNLIDEILILLAGGTETTSHLVLHILIFLAKHPEKKERLVKEIQMSNSDITFENINQLQYLSAVIQETLRLKSPGPLGTMKIASKDCKIGNFVFKKNTF